MNITFTDHINQAPLCYYFTSPCSHWARCGRTSCRHSPHLYILNCFEFSSITHKYFALLYRHPSCIKIFFFTLFIHPIRDLPLNLMPLTSNLFILSINIVLRSFSPRAQTIAAIPVLLDQPTFSQHQLCTLPHFLLDPNVLLNTYN